MPRPNRTPDLAVGCVCGPSRAVLLQVAVDVLPVDGNGHYAALRPRGPPVRTPFQMIATGLRGLAVASTFGVLGSVARKYAHRIPFIVKINHNELMTYPNRFDQVLFGTVEEAYDMGAAAVGATIYFGSDQSTRQIVEISQAFAKAHELGMATVLWCYLRNSAFKKDKDYHVSADLTGQANHLGVTIQADIIKQKLPENNGGYQALNSNGVATANLTSAFIPIFPAITRSI